MNTGQVMMVIFAFAMLSTLALAINGAITTTLTVTFESELSLNAHSISQSLLDEIMSQEFDEKTTGGVRVFKTADLTDSTSFGTDTGESMAGGVSTYDRLDTAHNNFHSQRKFDDVDDYQNYRRRVKNLLGWEFEAFVRIEYVSESNPNQVSGARTYVKRITVHVTHPNMTKSNQGTVIPATMRDLAIYRRYY